jgi:dihydrofolate reductase
MRKLILKMSVSIDGFVGGPNGEIDWIFKTMDEEATNWTLNTIWQAGVHIMGSRTFYDMASYWPYSTEVFAEPMNAIPKIAFSRKGSLQPNVEELTTRAFKDASSYNSSVMASEKPRTVSPDAGTWKEARIASDLQQEIPRLKREPGKDILAHGGASFAQSLIQLGLVDEYHLLTHPVALGKGLPIFAAISKPIDLELVNITPFKSGAVAHVYRPVSG